MTDSKQNKQTELSDPLLGSKNNYKFDADSVSVLFNQDTIKEMQPDTTVSRNLYQLKTNFAGVDGLAQGLDSNTITGIEGNKEDIAQRVLAFGSNQIKPRKTKTCCELLMEPFEDTILKILIVAAIVQLIIGIIQHGAAGMVDGVSIFLAIAIITLVTAGNNYVKEKQFQELQKKQDESTCLVIRNGIQSTVSTEELVVGDLVIVSYGMTVPADCVLITSSGVSCDEGALTGEPDELKKFHVTEENYDFNPNPFMLRSTLCVSGEGRALVVAVGDKTLSGRADAILNIEAELTPL